jgi:hypothetical protein
MRNMLVLSAAASALALVTTHQVAALSPGASATSPQGLVHKAQKSDDTSGARGQDGAQRGAQGQDTQRGAQGQGGTQRGAEPGQRNEGGTRAGAAQDKGERATDRRAGERGTRSVQQRSNVDINVDRGRRGHRDRVDRRTRVDVDVDTRRPRSGRRDVDIGVRSYGYSPANCQEILRRYRQCTARR